MYRKSILQIIKGVVQKAKNMRTKGLSDVDLSAKQHASRRNGAEAGDRDFPITGAAVKAISDPVASSLEGLTIDQDAENDTLCGKVRQTTHLNHFSRPARSLKTL
jgi:hypothetical protein